MIWRPLYRLTASALIGLASVAVAQAERTWLGIRDATSLQFDATGTYLYVADVNTHYTFNLTTQSFETDVSWGSAPPDSTISRDGAQHAWLSLRNLIVDTTVGQHHLRSFAGDIDSFGYDRTRDLLYIRRPYTNYVSAYDTNTFAELFRLNIGDGRNVTLSPDGSWMAVMSSSGIELVRLPANDALPPQPREFGLPRGMVFNHRGDHLYGTTGTGLIYSFDVNSGVFDRTFDVGGALNGIDISPDDSFLIAAQALSGGTEGTLHRVNLADGSVKNYNYPWTPAGWDVAITATNRVFFTNAGPGNEMGPIRQLDLATGAFSNRTDSPGTGGPGGVTYVAQIHRTPGGDRLYFTETLVYPASMFIYTDSTDTFGPAFHVPGDLVDSSVGINRDGTLLLMSAWATGASLESASDFSHRGTLPDLQGVAAFSPVSDVLYGTTGGSSGRIVGYDTNTLSLVMAFDTHVDIRAAPSHFVTGDMIASADGHHLSVSSGGFSIYFGYVYVVDIATQTATALPAPSATPYPSPTPVPSATPIPPPVLTVVPGASPAVSVALTPTKVKEGATATFTISASPNTARPIAVNYRIDGTAIFGADYTLADRMSVNGGFILHAGENSRSITVTTVADHVKESKEYLSLTLQPSSSYSVRKGTSAKLTLLDSP